ncbi:DUF4352 domain-containing protein [Mycolicibacterium fortuitum]|uniref:DUF4352 domain-containing protein n=1 Tax=Mycolicibacterium fortuitum TaxID=1766 RepID=UPI0013F66EBA|nr:DUF4352 domain-containing protein [Mycolicibacterium fortuitum]
MTTEPRKVPRGKTAAANAEPDPAPASAGLSHAAAVVIGLTTFVVGALGGCAVGCAVGSSSSGSAGTSRVVATSTAPPVAPPVLTAPTPIQTAKIGQEVRDQTLSFMVTGVEVSGDRYVVNTNVTNVGTAPATLAIDEQRILDTDNRQYAPNRTAALKRNDRMYIDINPGFYASLEIPFDIPEGTPLMAIQFHESSRSAGAWVDLRKP